MIRKKRVVLSNIPSFLFFLITGCLLGLVSCNRPSTNGNESHFTDVFSPDTKFISFPPPSKTLPGWSTENNVVVHTLSDPDNLHPALGNSAARRMINNYTQMFVVSYDMENLKLRPGIVTNLPEPSADGLRFTYQIRPEIRWDDGSPVTAEDILFTLKANKCPLVQNTALKPLLEWLQDVLLSQNNPLVATLVMKRKYIQNVAFLTDFPVMQRKKYDPENVLSKFSIVQFDDSSFMPETFPALAQWASRFNDSRWGRVPELINGLGPYQVTAWEPTQYIVLTKKKNHWTQMIANPSIYETAFPEKIIVKIIMDRTAQALELKAQKIDVSVNLSAETFLQLQSDSSFTSNYNMAVLPTFNYTYAAMNMKPDGIVHKKIFTDPHVRMAMAFLTPVDDIIRLVKKNMAIRITGPVSPLKDDFMSALEPVPFDISKASALLKQAGWMDSDGDGLLDQIIEGQKTKFSFYLLFMTSQPEWKQIAEMMAEAMLEAGVEAKLKPADPLALYEKAQQHDFDMLLGSWTVTSSPDDHGQLWHTRAWVSNGSNFTGFGNDATDALIDSMNEATDPPRYNLLSRRFQKIMYEEHPYVFISQNTRKIVMHKRFSNAAAYAENPGVMLNRLKVNF